MNQLKLRMKMRRKKPSFMQQGARGGNLKRLKETWRHPRGKHSKLREHEISKGAWPNPGYGMPRSVRCMHPSGLEEVRIFNVDQLIVMKPDKQACRIGASVGKKKRAEIMKKSQELKIRVLNPLKEKKA
jgi:large subunit ribosomal protein L32e